MGTIAIQTQCCLTKADDDDDDDDDDGGDGAEEESTAVQLVAPLPWHKRGGGCAAGRPDSPHPATNLSRSLSETSTIFFAPQQQQQQQQQTPARRA